MPPYKLDLLISASQAHLSTLENLLSGAETLNLDVRNIYGQTPLMLACINGHLQIAKLLLENGASVGITDNFGYSALDYAKNNRHESISVLIQERQAHVLTGKPQ